MKKTIDLKKGGSPWFTRLVIFLQRTEKCRTPILHLGRTRAHFFFPAEIFRTERSRLGAEVSSTNFLSPVTLYLLHNQAESSKGSVSDRR